MGDGGGARGGSRQRRHVDVDAPKIPGCSNNFMLIRPLPLHLLLPFFPERVELPAPVPDFEPMAGWPAEIRSGRRAIPEPPDPELVAGWPAELHSGRVRGPRASRYRARGRVVGGAPFWLFLTRSFLIPSPPTIAPISLFTSLSIREL
ncbi:hypothetical protein ACQJBY_059597 [Aegilops geniculata]